MATVIVAALVGTSVALGSSQLSGHTTSRSDSDHTMFWFGAHGQASPGSLHGWFHGDRRVAHRHGDFLATAASYLGISTDTLRADLKSGNDHWSHGSWQGHDDAHEFSRTARV